MCPWELGPREQDCSAGSSDTHLFCQLVQVRPVAPVVADVAEDGWLGEVVAAWSLRLLLVFSQVLLGFFYHL